MDKTEFNSENKIKIALKKAVGSIQKTLSLIEDGQKEGYSPDCLSVLIQLDSAIGSLKSSRRQILDHFLDICLDENLFKNLEQKDSKKIKIKNELKKIYNLAN
jgi:DNA-binding FrmR family transcriptional regulator